MKFLSVCSGIEAASVAWKPLGWEPVAFAEIERFPSAVLKHHYPDVMNVGDMTQLPDLVRMGLVEMPDMLCGGTPCQAFSVAGKRRSLEDERGNLSLVFCEIADAIDDERRNAGLEPGIVFWENVSGVLSTKDNAFGCFLGQLAGEVCPLEPAGGKWTNAGVVFGPARTVAWRVLDAQYFGLAQRRRRVFVVASAREGFDPAEVLLEWDGVRRDSAPSREAREGAAGGAGSGASGGRWPADISCTLNAAFGSKLGLEDQHINSGAAMFVPAAPVAFSIMPMNSGKDYKARETDIAQPLMAGGPVGGNQGGDFVAQPVAFHPTQDPISSTDGTTHAMGCGSSEGCATVAVAHTICLGSDPIHNKELAMPITRRNGDPGVVQTAMQVRRLTPVECERLQGFPDDYTAIPWRGKPADQCPDGPRYKALGNSWAVPVVRWIGRRIAAQLK